MTLSMVRGEHGNQRKELDHLIEWLRREARPDVVHLSNALMIGMARQIKQALQVPVVCSLAGEDIFLDGLSPKFRDATFREIRERISDVDRFVALNHYYADFVVEYLGVPRERTSVIPHGLKLKGHGSRVERDDGEVRIGYFARLCPAKGLHHLVDAFIELSQDQSLPPLRLAIAGYLSAGDRRYVEDLKQRWTQAGLGERVTLKSDLTRDEKIAFLQSLDVMSVPADYRESKGISILEALANAVPVVLPRHGTYPELIEDTQGGVLFQPHDPHDLAEQLQRLIVNPELREALGQHGQAAIHARYHDQLMAERHQAMYREVIHEYRYRASPAAQST
ncbi:MAG: glycosyltransferase family 4 protein [Planctomycetes bacterium]|nr:glycosyltransferase family 4 protein [Planctomycetota bacterium]